MYSVPPAKCAYHASRPAVAHCTICGRAVCRSCAQPDKKAKPICRPCALQTGVPQRRSTGVTILAALSIIMSALCLWCVPVALLGSALFAFKLDAERLIFGYATYEKANVAFNVITSIFAFVFGIGLLRLRDWARKGTIILQIFMLAWSAATQALLFAWIIPAEKAAGIRTFPVEKGLVWWAGSVSFYALYVVFFTRPIVKVQFGHQLKDWTPPSAAVPQDRR